AYGALKERLTLENTTGIAEYMEGKDAFVKDIIAKAKQWEAQDGMPESQRS
ncbi:GrpB family protein, partial [Candidatus Poribacteria bacterium]|nr:GrpB family protein [Candidatus Poribacteria bacterium]